MTKFELKTALLGHDCKDCTKIKDGVNDRDCNAA